MARLFGFIGNRPDLGAKVASAEQRSLEARNVGGPLGWGVGFYQGGEVLLRRRPLDDRPILSLADAIKDVRSDVLIGHIRQASVGALRTENTHPFRFRQWLFAHTGTIAAFTSIRERLVESLPEFLRRNIRGDTDSEVLFHLFLSFLHDAGSLGGGPVDANVLRTAIRSSASLIDRLSAEEGAAAQGFNILVTNGDLIAAVHAQGRMAYRVYEGRHDIEALFVDDELRKLRHPDVGAIKLSMVIAEYDQDPAGFTPVPERSILTLTRSDAPAVEAL